MRIRLPNGSSFRPEDLEEDLFNQVNDGAMTADEFLKALRFSGVPYDAEALRDLHETAVMLEDEAKAKP